MRRLAGLFLLALSLTAQTPIAGKWFLTQDFYGYTRYARLELAEQGGQVTSSFSGVTLAGTFGDGHLSLKGNSPDGDTVAIDATLAKGALTGTAILTNKLEGELKIPFTATLIQPVPHEAPRRHEFVPSVFYRQFSPHYKPVLTIKPGDTVHTTTVDAGGTDEKGVKRTAGGNPQTGPFYIEGAYPGDTLVVHINRLKLNRDWAGSDDGLVQTALAPDLAIKTRDNDKSIRWHLDLAGNTARPDPATGPLKTLAVPVHPMLGCIATAVGPAGAPPPTGDSGYYGGNMDFNEIAEGATVYLPVSNPGALLYVGDGHALQGDGELNGNALETSMNVEFTVDVIRGQHISGPRVETAATIMTVGYMGSLDDAFREATSAMATWLMDDYKLNPSELAQFLGATAQYKISEVADRNSGVVLKINKSILKTLNRTE